MPATSTLGCVAPSTAAAPRSSAVSLGEGSRCCWDTVGTLSRIGLGLIITDLTRYHFSGAKSAVQGLSQTKKYMSQVTEKVKQKTPEPSQALKWLRETTQAYAAFIPGARGYVDKAFDDLDRIHDKHGDQVDKIVEDTYEELKRVTKEKGASVEGVYEAWSVLERRIREITSLAGEAKDDILQNHPELREKLGGNMQVLQSMSESYGGQVREEVNKTFDQLRQIFSQGSTSEAIQQAQQVIKEKADLVKKMGDELWQRGMDKAKPYLDQNPQVKRLVEENKETLKQGNLGYLWAQVRNATESGSTQQLEQFVQHTKEQVQSRSSGGISSSLAGILGGGSGGGNSASGGLAQSALQSVSGGGEVMSKFQTLADIAKSNGKEAEELLSSTVEEIKEVLKRKTRDAENLASKARKEAS